MNFCYNLTTVLHICLPTTIVLWIRYESANVRRHGRVLISAIRRSLHKQKSLIHASEFLRDIPFHRCQTSFIFSATNDTLRAVCVKAIAYDARVLIELFVQEMNRQGP